MSDPEAIIRAELGPTENLLWAGRARRGIIFQSADRFWIPFALVWTGIVGYWLATTIPQWGQEAGRPLLVLPFFFLFGVHMLAGRFLVDATQRAHTCYGLSNERVIIVTELKTRLVRSVPLDTLNDVILKERPNGWGTITLGPLPPWYPGQEWMGWGSAGMPQLVLEEETRKVYEIILQGRRALKGKAGMS